MADVTVIGGGLAGSEAAWQAARRGADVVLYEMRPHKRGPAHHTGMLAELVCSNSLRGAALENAVGLLKEELARLDSLIVTSAREAAVPAGGALAVDRERFGALVEARLSALPNVEIRREEITEIPATGTVIVACGPLPSDPLARAVDALVGGRLHYYDAAAPIVALDSLDLTAMYRKSRYDKARGTTTSTSRSIARSTRDSLRICGRCPSTIRMGSRRTLQAAACRISRGVCRSRSLRRVVRRRCGTGRSSRLGCAIRGRGGRRMPSCSCAKRTARARRSTSSVFRRA